MATRTETISLPACRLTEVHQSGQTLATAHAGATLALFYNDDSPTPQCQPMTNALTQVADEFEAALETKHLRRLRAEDRFLARIEKLEASADALIGEVVRGGRTVCYVNTRKGTVKEGGRAELTRFLIRNRYV